ncbi:MAG: malate synthase A, partial [Microbacteriaceae bacterium]|nr:malate synthase A [Microbacteriaceae bacterium]
LDVRIGRSITEAGVRDNVSVAIRYIEAWLRGQGAVAIDNLMEDAATAEISRSQIWQWVQQDQRTSEGRQITREWVAELVDEAIAGFDRTEGDRYDDAAQVFTDVALGNDFPAFLTVPAYSRYLIDD